jgi:transcriptional regulator with XRE-family HTH domain
MLVLPPIGFIGGCLTVRSIRDIAAAARGRRQELGLSQADLAKRAGVSRKWIYEFEAAKSGAELGLVLRVLDELGVRLELLEPEAKPATGDPDSIDLDTLLAKHGTVEAAGDE